MDVIVTEFSAVQGNNTGLVGVLAGNGDGTFKPVAHSPLPIFSIAVDDFNCDKKLDVVGATYATMPGSVQIALGDGRLGLGAPNVSSAGAHSLGVAVSDFNHDGLPDVATVNQTDATVSVLLNTSK